jgi:hypothetical protein
VGPSSQSLSYGARALTEQYGVARSASLPSAGPAQRIRLPRYFLEAIVVGLVTFVLLSGGVQPLNSGSAAAARTPGPHAEALSTPISRPDARALSPISTRGSASWSSTATVLPSQFSWSNAQAPPIGNLTGSGLASDPGPEEAVLFGGDNSTGLQNRTWVYWESNNTWSTRPTPARLTPRSDFGFAGDATSSVAVLFGGRANDTTGRVDADTWVFNFTLGTWSNVTKAAAPPARQDPAFAVAPSSGEALLYGGWNRNLSGAGALIYSDTWILNLSTYSWTPAPVASGVRPPPLEGASMSWDPTLGQFQLFGGCFPCVSAVWRYTPSTDLWSEANASGTPPSPRGSPAWAYDPAQQLDVLFGGVGNGGSLNDTYTWSPVSGNWTSLTLAVHPTGLTGAAATWMDVPTNETLLLTEGSRNSSVANLWRFAPLAKVSVLVLNVSTALPVERATVTVDGTDAAFTDAFGYRNLTGVTPVEHAFSVIAPGYARTNRTVWIDPGLLTLLVLNLTPIPPAELTVEVVNTNGIAVAGASVAVFLDGALFLNPPALTDSQGVANYSGIPTFPVEVNVSAIYYHPGSQSVNLVAGEHSFIQVQLTPFPVAQVHVLGYLPPLGISWPLLNAQVSVDPESVGFTDITGTLVLQLDVDGVVQFTGNAPGFVPTEAAEDAPYTGLFPVNLTLTSLPFGAVDIYVLVVHTHTPLPGSYVNVSTVPGVPLNGLQLSARADPTGYSNDSYPPTSFDFSVEHSGYLPNDTLTNISVAPSSEQAITVYLTPLPSITSPGGNGTFNLFPRGQPIAWVFLVVPLLLLLAGATYLGVMRGEPPPPRSLSTIRRIPKPPPPPDPRHWPPPPPGG